MVINTIQKFSCDFLRSLPEFSEGEEVTHVWWNGEFRKLDFPTAHAEIQCPSCKSFEGYRVSDAHDKKFCGWSCLQEECISQGMPKKIFTPQRPTVVNCGAPDFLQNACMLDIEQPLDVTKKIIEFCHTYRGFFLMAGLSGRGKTYCSVACLAKYLEKKDSAKFANVAELYVKWLALKHESKSDLGLLEKYTECEFLILDDLGTRTPTDAFLDFLYLLINKRYGKSHLGTIVSTNLGYEELAEKMGDAIVSRISSGMIVKFTGENKRKPKF